MRRREAGIGDCARQLAASLLLGVLEQRQSLAELEARPPFIDAPPQIRSRAGRLARATLRSLGPADHVLNSLMRRAPKPEIHTLLRLGAVEMLAEGGPPHGVVGACVALAKRQDPRAAGLVNAVLRRVAETPPEVWAAAQPRRLPGWLRGRLGAAYGNARTARIEAAVSRPPPVDLTPKVPGAAWAAALDARLLPTGSLRREAPGQISALPGFSDGAWWVQDAAAALPARLLAPEPGARVLDLCAAPGGKTLQLAAAGARVTALDISEARLLRLRENLDRTGLAADIVAADALTWQPDAPFDAILLDAPCSATGTLRRHPDLPFVRQAADLKPLKALQAALLDRAADWLVPGGRLVYSTCSLLPEEGEAQIAAALESGVPLQPDAGPIDVLPGLEPDWVVGPGALRLTPEMWDEIGGLDGFYMAALRRSG